LGDGMQQLALKLMQASNAAPSSYAAAVPPPKPATQPAAVATSAVVPQTTPAPGPAPSSAWKPAVAAPRVAGSIAVLPMLYSSCMSPICGIPVSEAVIGDKVTRALGTIVGPKLTKNYYAKASSPTALPDDGTIKRSIWSQQLGERGSLDMSAAVREGKLLGVDVVVTFVASYSQDTAMIETIVIDVQSWQQHRGTFSIPRDLRRNSSRPSATHWRLF
jgi:hypothetical protein